LGTAASRPVVLAWGVALSDRTLAVPFSPRGSAGGSGLIGDGR